jgi:glycosyltransferase involved in cell wall biosynthesis
MPVYNGEKYFRFAIDSLLEQDYADFELVISDNASTDATGEICQEFAARDRRIRYYRNQTNIGATGNYNRVFELARGQLFKWATHDDLHLPGCLSRCVEVLDRAPSNVVLVAPRTEIIDENGRRTGQLTESLHTSRWLPHQRVADVLRNVAWATAQFGLFRSEALRKTRLLGPFLASDWVLLSELAILGEIWEIPEILFQRRLHPEVSTFANKTHAELAEWFDTSRKPRKRQRFPRIKLALQPRIKVLWEYGRSIARMPMPARERFLCFLTAFSIWFSRESRRLSAEYSSRVWDKSVRALVGSLRNKAREHDTVRRNICFFGHFSSSNFGNQMTLQILLHHLRQRLPKATFTCISVGPEALRATQEIETVTIYRTFVKTSTPLTRLTRWLRKIFVELPSEPWRWFDAFRTLKSADALIIPGTGSLTDAYGLFEWGPYNLFRWSLVAKLCGCKILFVSVGVGPIYTTLGRCFVRSALFMADFRSYGDHASLAYLKGIGFPTNGDRVYPDLALSLPEILGSIFQASTGSN